MEKGIAICGSGIGISIACNKVRGIRCAKVNNTKETRQARRDNNANIIALSGKMPLIRAKDIIDVYMAIRNSKRIYPDSRVKECAAFREKFKRICEERQIYLPDVRLEDVMSEEDEI